MQAATNCCLHVTQTVSSFELGVTDIDCRAHARGEAFEQHATNKSFLVEQPLRIVSLLYKIDNAVRDLQSDLRGEYG